MGISTVRVLGKDYEIEQKDMPDHYGLCWKEEGRIDISINMTPFGYKDYVLHELMHAILYQQGATHAYKLEESFVRPLAKGLITLFQDNPDLAKWLIHPIQDTHAS